MRPLVVVALLLGGARPAGAEERTPAEIAKAHYLAASRLFNLAKYDEAIHEFEEAYKAKDDPVFLYNIGQSHRLAGHLELSVRFYRNYLRMAPESPKRGEIEARIEEMERALATQRKQDVAEPVGTSAPDESAKAQAPPPAETAKRGGAGLRVGGAALLAAGLAAALGGGIGFGLAGEGKAAAIQAQASSGAPFDPSLDDDRQTFATLSLVSWIAGGALAVTGAVLLIVGLRARGGAAQALRLAPAVAPGAAGVLAGGAF